MGRRKTGAMPTNQPKKEKKMVIDMNEMNRKKEFTQVTFKTGKYMTAKDRPRKKNWKQEYMKESGGNRGGYLKDSFLFA